MAKAKLQLDVAIDVIMPLVESLRDAADVLERYEMDRQADRRAAQALRAAHEQP